MLRPLRLNYPWVFLAILIIFFSLHTSVFPNGNNFIVIARSVSVTGLLALGNSFVFLGGGVDVSIITIASSSAMLNAKIYESWGNPQAALALALIYALALGLINGLLVTKARIAPFIATLASSSIFNGFTERISGGFSIFNLGEQHDPPEHFFGNIGRGTVGVVPVQVIIFGALAVVSLLVFTSTVFGRHLYAAGANPTAARLSGVNVDRIRIGTYLICGLLCGMAGLIRSSDLGHASREGATVVTQGPGLLDSIGAVLIGGTALSGGVGTIQGTVAGSLIIGTLNNGLNLNAVAAWGRLLSSGGVVIGAVAIGSVLAGATVLQVGGIRESLAHIVRQASILWRRPARL